MLNKRKVVLGAGAAAVAAALSLGAAGMASAETTSTAEVTSTAAASPGEGGGPGGHHGGRGGFDAAALAAKLGVDETAVTEALQSVRENLEAERDASTERPERAEMESMMSAALAEALGVEEAAVQTALDELRAEKSEERAAEIQDKLDAAVTDGSLSQAEADGAAKAVEKGIIGGGR